MKQTMITAALLLFVALFMAACPKSVQVPEPHGDMIATVNGISWRSISVVAADTSINGCRQLSVFGYNTSASKYIQLDIRNYDGSTGVYTIASPTRSMPNPRLGMVSCDISGQKQNGVSGQVVITFVAGRTISGAFNFITANGATVSNGAFSVALK